MMGGGRTEDAEITETDPWDTRDYTEDYVEAFLSAAFYPNRL
jgi:hypothetical protein